MVTTRSRKRQFQNVQFCSRSRKAKILTTGIHGVFRGLKFEPDADIGQISADFERGRFEIGSKEKAFKSSPFHVRISFDKRQMVKGHEKMDLSRILIDHVE